jgi:O-antigen/teichoic acid export membrane protein
VSLNISAKKATSYFSGSKIFKAYFTSILGVFSGLLTQLLFIRELTKTISTEQFSIYAYIFQVVSYLAVFQLGMDFTISREVAINLASNNYSLANYSYGFIQRFNRKVIIIASCCVSLLALGFLFGIGLDTDEGNRLSATLLVLLFGVFQVLNFFVRPYTAALIGANYQNVVNLNNVFINIISTVFGYILLKIGFGYYSLPFAMVFWAVVNIYVLKRLVNTKCPWIFSERQPINKELDKASFKFGLTGTLGGVAWTIESTADVILLNAAGLVNLVGLYVIWWRFPQMFFDLASRLTTSAYPSIAAANGQSEENTRRLFSKLLLVVSGFSFIISIGLFFWLPAFINLWVGPKFSYEGAHMFSMLIALLVFFRIVGNCLGMSMVSIGYVRVTSLLSWIQAGIKVVGGYFLLRQFGLQGLVAASVVCSLIQVLFLAQYCVRKRLLSKGLILLVVIMGLFPLCFIGTEMVATAHIGYFIVGGILTVLASSVVWYATITLTGFNFLLFKKQA